MQTFLPYPDFAQSAACLDNKRLGKQRVECLQILRALSKGKYTHQCAPCKYVWTDSADLNIECPNCKNYFDRNKDYLASKCIYTRVTPWYNHPAVKMWRGWECTLMEYSHSICQEWIKRGFKDTCHDKIVILHYGSLNACHIVTDRQQGHNEYYTPWLGNSAFHASHRSNLLRKDPAWYGQFGWTEPNNLPYVWPI